MKRVGVTPIGPAIGAEIAGVDLANDLANPDVFNTIRQAFIDHHVLVFRDQEMDRVGHKAFARLFGQLHVHPSQRRAAANGDVSRGDPEVFTVVADEDTVLNNGGLWHTDVSCDEIPPMGSMLLLSEAPPSGGDTLFANMHRAYETLSAPIRKMLLGLTARHDQRQDLGRYGYEPKAGVDYPAATHPIVVAHPDTGRPLLYVNPAFTTGIDGLSEAESRAVLAMLHNHVASSPAIQCRVAWQPGTLTFWDNRCTQHYAVWDYRPHRRCGDRVTIAGTAPPIPVT